VSASRCLAEVQSRAVDGATAPSNIPSCAGEFSLATDSAKRSMKYLAEREPGAIRVSPPRGKEARDVEGMHFALDMTSRFREDSMKRLATPLRRGGIIGPTI